ncbi:MAG: hypothetical protein ACO1O6_12000 [Bacteroidota bacterium]
MKKTLFTVCVMLLCQLAQSQTTSSFTKETLSANRVELSVSIQGDLNDLDSVRIVLFEKRNTDTLLTSEFSFSVSDNDPSEFYSFSQSTGKYAFGLGQFDAGLYYCKLYMKREGEWEETNLN